MNRLRSRLTPTIWLTGFLLLTAIVPAEAQVRPLDSSMIMQAPIRTLDSDSVPVTWMRVYVTLETEWANSVATASIMAASGPDSLLVLNVADMSVSELTFPGLSDPPDFTLTDETLTIRVPETDTAEWRVDMRYRLRQGLRGASEDNQPSVIWTSSLPGRTTWMPLPTDEIAALDIDLTVAAPPGWSLAVSNASADDEPMILEGRQIIAASFKGVYPRAVGFLAWKGNAYVMTSSQAAERYDWDSTWVDAVYTDDSGTEWAVLEVDGESTPAGFRGPAVRTMGNLGQGSEWMRLYERLWRDHQLLLSPALARLAPTDYWIEAGLSSWMAVERIRAREGDAAAGLVFDELRRRYLQESKVYQRPLVWDRWYVAADLRDRHAEAKGAWVFRMIHERLGPDAFSESIRRFFSLATEEIVDSETLRQQFEVVSREDLGEFFDTWVYAAGHPVISLSYEFDPESEQTNLRLVQHQEGTHVPETFVFDAAFQYSTLAETNSVTLRVDERDRRSRIPTGIPPRFIHPDALATVPLDFQQAPGEADLVSQLRFSLDAASTIRSLHLLAESTLDPTLLLGLRAAISTGTDPAILAEAAPVLGRMAPSSSALNMLIDWTTHEDARVRAAATTALSAFEGVPDAYDAALQVANAGSEAIELAAAVKTLAVLRPDRAWPVLQAALVTPSEGELVRITALDLIEVGITEDGDIADAVLPLLELSPDVGAAALRCLARAFPEGPRTTRQAEGWLKEASSIRREAAIATIEMRAIGDLPEQALRSAFMLEPDLQLKRRLGALLTRLDHDSEG